MNSAQFRVALNSLINWLSKRNSVSLCFGVKFCLFCFVLFYEHFFCNPVEGSLWHNYHAALQWTQPTPTDGHPSIHFLSLLVLRFGSRGGCSLSHLSWSITDREHLIHFPRGPRSDRFFPHSLCTTSWPKTQTLNLRLPPEAPQGSGSLQVGARVQNTCRLTCTLNKRKKTCTNVREIGIKHTQQSYICIPYPA